jgi:hypothetical protein
VLPPFAPFPDRRLSSRARTEVRSFPKPAVPFLSCVPLLGSRTAATAAILLFVEDHDRCFFSAAKNSSGEFTVSHQCRSAIPRATQWSAHALRSNIQNLHGHSTS